MSAYKVGDVVTIEHDCAIDDDGPGDLYRYERHEADIEIREATQTTFGMRYRGFRCDGSRIEWVEP